MILIDYLYYHYYMYLRNKRQSHDEAIFFASWYATLLVAMITIGIWTNFLGLIFVNVGKVIPIVLLITVWLCLKRRYIKINHKLIMKFCHNKFNKIIPGWSLFLFFIYFL